MLASLRQRLMLSHLIVILLAMGAVAVILQTALENYFLSSAEDSLVAQANFTVQTLLPNAHLGGSQNATQSPLNNTIQQQAGNLNLQTGPITPTVLNSGDLSTLADIPLQLGTQLDTRVRLINLQGRVLADSAQTDIGADLQNEALVVNALQGQSSTRLDITSDTPTAFVARPVLSDGQIIGVVYLSQSLHDMQIVLNDLRTRLLQATLFALVFSALVGWWLSRRITRPVQQLTSAAEAVAAGRFDQPVVVKSRDELGRLGHTFNDMTTRLNAARQMQIDFVANVSHELRTPLTSIKGTVETLREGAVDDLAVRDRFLETIESETDRLTRLVNDLLILSRADSAALNLRRQPLDMGQLVQTVADRLAEQAQARDLMLEVAVKPNVPLASADADRIEQVLRNLIDNAIKYSRPGGTITLRVTAVENDAVLVEVRDEGLGIPAAELPRVGQRFYRADKARSREQGGHGLGLAIAQSLVHAHGGELWLESAEGVGTTASFTLPAA